MASGSGGFTSGSGMDFVSPRESLASTFSVFTGFAGSGTLLTSVAPMASPPPPAPHPSPRFSGMKTAYTMMNTANAKCNTSDQASGRPKFPLSKKMSALAAIALQRLRHDTHVADARLLHRVHHEIGRASCREECRARWESY